MKAGFAWPWQTARLDAGPSPSLLLGLAVQLLAQQRTELGGAARSIGRRLVVLGQRFLRLGFVLGLDRELHQAALAIGADDLGFDLVADLQALAGVLDALV